jgi:hypothetical protein
MRSCNPQKEAAMSHCSVCLHDVDLEPPNHAYWGLIGSFWAISLPFGIGAAVSTGWGFLILITWVLLATSAGVLVQHATSWSCSDCGATLPPPVLRPSFFVNPANR